MANSTPKKPIRKPSKPYPDFPLFPHATRRWAKKIRGKLLYFGPWDNPDGALQRYLDQKDDLHAGRTPRAAMDGLTVRDLLNRFLTAKRHLVDTQEITARTFADYYATCERIKALFGLTRPIADLATDDFERLRAVIAKAWGPVALGNEIGRVRVLFKYAYDAGLIDKPVRYGPTFKRPSKTVFRRLRAAKGPRMFEAAELQRILNAAGVQVKAMILLGINCGFGNADVATLPVKAFDLNGGWINYPRPKTGIDRRCPLWPETVAALRAAIAKKPEPKDPADKGLAFITKYGQSWLKSNRLKESKVNTASPISAEFAKILRQLKLQRKGLGFYALRHTLETIGGDSRDQVAVDHIMGHARDDMASVYRERISDERLRAVTEHVYKWLFG